MEKIELYYSNELEKHFQIEESHIGIHLEALDKTGLTEQLYKEHKDLRDFFKPGASRSAANLAAFAKLLEQHVRFEERELFNVAQESLSPEALNTIKDASNK